MSEEYPKSNEKREAKEARDKAAVRLQEALTEAASHHSTSSDVKEASEWAVRDIIAAAVAAFRASSAPSPAVPASAPPPSHGPGQGRKCSECRHGEENHWSGLQQHHCFVQGCDCAAFVAPAQPAEAKGAPEQTGEIPESIVAQFLPRRLGDIEDPIAARRLPLTGRRLRHPCELEFVRLDVVERRVAEANREWSSGFAKHGVQLPASEVANYLTGLFDEMSRVVAERDAWQDRAITAEGSLQASVMGHGDSIRRAESAEARVKELASHLAGVEALEKTNEEAHEHAIAELRAKHDRVVGELKEAQMALSKWADWYKEIRKADAALGQALVREPK